MKLDILAIAAHPDDIELTCSGTLMKEIDKGNKVGIVDLTEGSLGSRGSVELRYKEADRASKIMGIHARQNLQMRDGFFEETEENLLAIVRMIRLYQPKIVLANSISDRHPDHGRASKLVSRACFLSGLLKIETEYNGDKQLHWRPNTVYHYIQDRMLAPDFVIDVSDYMERKIQVIQAFSSQFFNPEEKFDAPETPISSSDFIDFVKARGREFGRPIQATYGEGYTVERVLGVESLFDLS